MEDDAELIVRYLDGDLMAGSLLVARHSAALFGWLRWKTGSHEDAEDLMQTVWMQAFPALPNLHDRAAFRAWLFTLCRHAFGSWLRERRPTCSLDAPGANGENLLPTSSGALDGVEDRVALQNALMQLSEDHRDTFLLRYATQFSAGEVAQILNVPVGTVESRCHFARVRLRRWLVQSEALPGDTAQAQTDQGGDKGAAKPDGGQRHTAGADKAQHSHAAAPNARPTLLQRASAGLKTRKPPHKGFTK